MGSTIFSPALVIQRKRDGKELSSEQIHAFIKGLSTGDVADYQVTAFLMAVYFKGMTLAETIALTEAMLESGDRYALDRVKGTKVDKHSTGGVGDKVSLILAPLAAACGVSVPMMAGRGLGHTGGTVDKLESIPGFNVNPSPERFEAIVAEVGCAIIAQSERIVPADKKMYALRDVTATIECIPLIVASILSKKLAEGTGALVMDVKVGNGAFMKSREQARRLSKTLVAVAKKMGLPMRAILTDMSQPLGYAVGNSLEIIECIEILKGGRDDSEFSSVDIKELTLQLCAQMLHVTGTVKNLNVGRKLARDRLEDGSAYKKFEEMVVAQGGSLEVIRNPERLPSSPRKVEWKARKKGFITQMDTESLGRLLVELGGGRRKTTDRIDFGVGLLFHKKLGSKVQAGETLVTVHAPDRDISGLEQIFHDSVQISGSRKPVPKLIVEVVG